LTAAVLLAGRCVLADVGFSAAVSTNSIVVSNTLTYTFNLTNVTGLDITNVFLTNQLSIAFATNQPGWVTVNSNTIVLPIGTLLTGTVLQTNWSGTPNFSGVRTNDVSLTNKVTLVAGGQTNVTTNLVTQILIPKGDLGVSISVPTQGVLAGDVMVVDVTVTNLGPDTIQNITLTNLLPASFKLLTPTNLISIFTNGTLTVNVGNLAIHGSTNLHLTVQPTNSGNFTLGAVVVAASLVDTNLANNTASTNVSIGVILGATLTNSVVTAQHYNPQTGLMEEIVRVTNIGTNDAPSFRLIVSGLGTNWMYNAFGTNNGDPYVLYGATLAAGSHVDLRLEYFVWKRTALDLDHTAVAVGFTSVPTPTSSSPNITKVNSVPTGLLIEFQSIIGRSYSILYADNMSFSNALAAQPVVTAIADRVQWIDSGPPKTITSTTNAGSRFYRVLLNP
jgi:uncharacterized repeat protein (TIGR01451 family)